MASYPTPAGSQGLSYLAVNNGGSGSKKTIYRGCTEACTQLSRRGALLDYHRANKYQKRILNERLHPHLYPIRLEVDRAF